MRRLVISDTEIMSVAVQQEISRSEESRYDHRLHGILLVCQGFSCAQVADLFGHDTRTIERWVRRFEGHGFAGLREQERHGRPTSLNEKQWASIAYELRRSPREFGYTQNFWDGKLLSHHLASRHNVNLGARQCQRIFRKLGFRLRKPRPVIAKSDPTAQVEFKKNSTNGRKSRH